MSSHTPQEYSPSRDRHNGEDPTDRWPTEASIPLLSFTPSPAQTRSSSPLLPSSSPPSCLSLMISLGLRLVALPWRLFHHSYNRLTAWLFPNEPEPLDLHSTLFFICQVPFLFLVFLSWIPMFVHWLLGIRTSQAGDRGQGRGMRSSWTTRLALSLSFLKAYLHHAENLTIEACQRRSRSIPFMTAPAGIRVKKIKVPVFPWRAKAEAFVYDCLTEQEREWASMDCPLLDHGQSPFAVMVQQDSNQGAQDGTSKRYSQPTQGKDKFDEGLDAEWLECSNQEHDSDVGYSVVLYLHGGGYYTGSKEEHRVLIGPLVKRLGKNIRVLTVNYRLAPQTPFPGALVDALSCYMWMLDQNVAEVFSLPEPSPATFSPHQIIWMGDSAGGGLALSMSLLLRDHGSIPQPSAIVTWSPWVDLTQSLPSFKENALNDCIPYEDFTHRHSVAVDNMFGPVKDPSEHSSHTTMDRQERQRAQVYCPDSCLRMRYVSPLFETNLKGLPPVFITCGSGERFANECVLMAARLEEQGQPCRLEIHEDMPHIFPLFRFHSSSITALDRTSAYIRKVLSSRPLAAGNVIIPISSATSSAVVSPSLPSRPFELGPTFEQEQGMRSVDSGWDVTSDMSKSTGIRRVGSASSFSSAGSVGTNDTAASASSSLATSCAPSWTAQSGPLGPRLAKNKRMGLVDRSESGASLARLAKNKIRVNVIDLNGKCIPMRLHDVVSKATLYEWEVLLNQGSIPVRLWPHPPEGSRSWSIFSWL